ncbi:cell division protein ZapE [Paludibacterium paludis]|uniref:Cell division protein ZapE n=1 Tax=Paludibacterium paludis TaxID=1225769 RepID=A0A918P064_9NEIS|nr:cell division protein ZapE [Paludibacterium paludis]GGY10698.1 cell division protein ZapE [Paludibacterium paludis]
MAQHVFTPVSDGTLSPRDWYEQALAQNGFIRDEAQARAIERLDTLWHALVDFKQRRNRFLGRSLRSPEVPNGLYLWGGVGRGKSFLMDAFFTCVPYQRKQRVHFHHFMAEIHRQLGSLSKEPDPLVTVADRIARTTRLLCFDEFHVSDIADAMILSRLLEALFARGVVMVMTSNYPPDGLYPNGLQRHNFLPAIDLLKSNLEVINVDGGNDYRLRELTREPLFMVPAGEAADLRMSALFDKLAGGQEPLPGELTVLGRTLHARRHVHGVIWFDFDRICDGPRAQTDYLELARDYHTVFVSNIPKLEARDASQARRFTWLVDVFYDHRVKLVASAAVDAEGLYTEGVQSGEFFRTASRLTEMQSQSYLALPHLVDQFQLDPSRSVAL